MAWTEDEKTRLRDLWLSGRGSGEIARHLGTVSRNAVMGMVNRLGLMGKQGSGPSQAEVILPATDVPKPANDDPTLPLPVIEPMPTEPANDEPAVEPPLPPAALRTSEALTLLEEAFEATYDPRSPGHVTGLVTIAAVIAGRDDKAIARITGLRRSTAATALELIDDAGIWRAGDLAPRYWIDPRSGNVSFIMDMLVAEGIVDRVYDDTVRAWRYGAPGGRMECAA